MKGKQIGTAITVRGLLMSIKIVCEFTFELAILFLEIYRENVISNV